MKSYSFAQADGCFAFTGNDAILSTASYFIGGKLVVETHRSSHVSADRIRSVVQQSALYYQAATGHGRYFLRNGLLIEWAPGARDTEVVMGIAGTMTAISELRALCAVLARRRFLFLVRRRSVCGCSCSGWAPLLRLLRRLRSSCWIFEATALSL